MDSALDKNLDMNFRSIISSLTNRGLLRRFHDHYNLHPIVQTYAYSKLNNPNYVHIILAEYYSKYIINKLPKSFNDLKPSIELYRHLSSAREFDLACDYLFANIIKPLFFDFGAYFLLNELVYELFPNGLKNPPMLQSESAQAHVLSLYGRVLSITGNSSEAITARLNQMKIRENQGDLLNLSAGLGYLSQDQILLGDLAGAIKSLESSLEILDSFDITEKSNDKIDFIKVQKALHLTFLTTALIHSGQYNRAKAVNNVGGELWESLNHHKIGLCGFRTNNALLALCQNDPNRAIFEASKANNEAELEGYERGKIISKWLSGSAHILVKNYKQAKEDLLESLARCRTSNFVESEADILLELAKWNFENNELKAALEFANESLNIAERCNYRLKKAEAFLVFAGLNSHLQKMDIAKKYCHEALIHSFSDEWKVFISNKKWKKGWWEACVADLDSREGNTIIMASTRWKSGYKPCMDKALFLMNNLEIK